MTGVDSLKNMTSLYSLWEQLSTTRRMCLKYVGSLLFRVTDYSCHWSLGTRLSLRALYLQHRACLLAFLPWLEDELLKGRTGITYFFKTYLFTNHCCIMCAHMKCLCGQSTCHWEHVECRGQFCGIGFCLPILCGS